MIAVKMRSADTQTPEPHPAIFRSDLKEIKYIFAVSKFRGLGITVVVINPKNKNMLVKTFDSN